MTKISPDLAATVRVLSDDVNLISTGVPDLVGITIVVAAPAEMLISTVFVLALTANVFPVPTKLRFAALLDMVDPED